MGDITVKEYFESQIAWLDKYFHAKIHSIDEAVNKAEAALSKRLESMNEFRDSLKDQAARLATKTEVEMQITALEQRLQRLEMGRANADGKATVISAIVSVVVSAVTGLIIGYMRS